EVAGDEDDALRDEIVCHGDCLLRIAGIVTHAQSEVLAEHTAMGVDILDGHFCAMTHLVAERRIFPGHRTCRGHSKLPARAARFLRLPIPDTADDDDNG